MYGATDDTVKDGSLSEAVSAIRVAYPQADDKAINRALHVLRANNREHDGS